MVMGEYFWIIILEEEGNFISLMLFMVMGEYSHILRMT